jgi:plasmid stabilization system protein ParE
MSFASRLVLSLPATPSTDLEHGMHVVFYRQERGGILVSRILHQRMLPDRHSTEDQDDEA